MKGRRIKLDEKRQAIICGALRTGASWAAAAAAAGLHIATVMRWRARGEAQESGKYREFCEATTHAIDQGEAIMARQVWKAANEPTIETVTETFPDGSVKTKEFVRPPSGGMALKWLERKRAEQWSPRHRVAIGGDADAPPVQHGFAVDKLPADKLAALAALLDEAAGADDSTDD